MLHTFAAHTGSPLYSRYFAFRQRIFNRQLGYWDSGYPVYSFPARPAVTEDAFEYDAYDLPKAIYTVYVDPAEDRILGCFRLVPADAQYMVRDSVERGIWRGVELLQPLLVSNRIYEGSRIAVAPGLSKEERRRILHALVLSNVDMAVRIGFDAMIGIMSDAVWTSVYRRRGLDVRYLSRPFRVDENDPMVIGLVSMKEHHLAALRQHFDVEHRVDPALERMHRAHATAT
ncbi:MAG: acyl-homoserine-lactone synthase [Pseudomonadota bacterium]